MRFKDEVDRVIDRLQRNLRRTPPALRRWAAMLVDAAIVLESFAVALLFRFNGDVPGAFLASFWPFAAFGAAVFVVLLRQSGVYQSILKYTGIYQGIRVASATSIATGALVLADFAVYELVLGYRPVPLSVLLVGAVLAYLQLVAVRLYPRVFYELSLREIGRRKRTVIVGTQEPGAVLARQLRRSPEMDAQVVAFVSEAAEEVGRDIEGVPVAGNLEGLQGVIEKHGVDQAIVAVQGASREQMDGIWRACMAAAVEVKVMPDLGELLSPDASKLRELRIEDLLGREPVEIDVEALAGYLNGKRVLVTGAGGSIGKELSRQISRLGPAKLILLDRDESGLYYLGEELHREEFLDAEMLVGDVAHPERMGFVFERYEPQVVFHAAALKHVPMMEMQASEAIRNNVFGTLTVARLAGETGAEKFINVSTDKAVNPANVMGATKRLAEMIVHALSHEFAGTVNASVRFGNVLGSRGSVVPTFRQQIEAGGPVTVTHPGMVRYFMTIPEAVSLILQAGALADSYGTYLLEMGRPVAIVDLAKKMIALLGATDVDIKHVGLRPGEKLSEELLERKEHRVGTDHPMVFRLVPENLDRADHLRLLDLVDELAALANDQETAKAVHVLRQAVPSYSARDSSSLLREGGLNYPPQQP
jgi:FlaA1/EpsC-like NDP-sugar epimerase